jgi:Cu/Ag efflux pump CusA
MKISKYSASVFATIVVLACSNGASGTNAAVSEKTDIQNELDANPVLTQKGIKATVQEFKSGFLTVAVSGFGPDVTAALQRGQSIQAIAWGISGDAQVLMKAEEGLMKRPEVKGVVWVAAAQPGSSPSQ